MPPSDGNGNSSPASSPETESVTTDPEAGVSDPESGGEIFVDDNGDIILPEV